MYCRCTFLMLALAGALGAMSVERPSVSELLAKCAETQKRRTEAPRKPLAVKGVIQNE